MNISDSQLKTLIKEELELMRLEKIMLSEARRIDKLHEEMQLELLSEGWKEELPHIGLDVLGLIPGVGEAADLTNAALYAKKGEHLMAALYVISMIPAVGDALGKGGKIATYLGKFGAKGGTKAGAALSKLFAKHMPKITKAIGALKSNKLIGPYVDDMARAVTKYADDLGTKAADEVLPQLQKAVGVAPAPKVSKNQYLAAAQKVKAKSDARQNRQDIADKVADKVSGQTQQQVAEQEDEEQPEAPKVTPEFINDLLKGVEQFGKDPAVIDALGKDGIQGALRIIRSKIMADEEPAVSDDQGLAGIMEKELTKPEKKEKEKIVKGMKKNKKGFKQRYGDDAESVMYATATKIAKEKK